MIGETFSHYEVVEKLGEGGMGVVYKARDVRLNRLVALKMLPPATLDSPERRRRFLEEARAASALNHPNIVTIHDIGSEQGRDFIVMEYVAGKSLDEAIPPRGMPLAEALSCALQIAGALAAAHGAGIVHRDLKPGNVMLTEDGTAKVVDFGLARPTPTRAAAAGGSEQPTQTMGSGGEMIGTVAYMSPEQAEGERVDQRSDIFSFGALLYEMVTGRRAFQGSSGAATLAALLREDPKPPGEFVPDCPPELDRVLARCLRKDRERRFQHMADVRVALREIEEDISKRRAPMRRRSHAALSAAVALALIAAGFAGWTWWRGRSGAPEAKLLPLTSEEGFEAGATFSPDGNQVAYSWDGNQENMDIWTRLIDSGAPPLRLTKDPAMDISPSWSPDGRQVAFVRRQRGDSGLFLTSPLGGPERRLADADESRPSWSPDGNTLAVAQGQRGQPRTVVLVSVQTGEAKPLTIPVPDTPGDDSPAFSPDGQRIAFVRWRASGVSDVFVTSSTPGGELRQITFDASPTHGLCWTRAGSEIVFSSRRSGTPTLWRVSAAGGTPERIALAGEGAQYPVIGGPSGSRLAFTQMLSDTNIWKIETGSGAARRTRLIASTRAESSAQFSPDGKKIVFVSNRSGQDELWVCDADGTGAFQLSRNMGRVGAPRWSPDGREIAFDSRVDGNADIYVIAADGGGGARRLTAEESEEARPTWSHDGRWVYFRSNRGGGRQIWKAPAAGGVAVQVTQNGGFEAQEALDGSALYVAGSERGRGIWRAPLDGKGVEEPVIEERIFWGFWTVAKSGIYFLSGGPEVGTAVLRHYRFDMRRVSDVAETPRVAGMFTPPSLAAAPDERTFLVCQVDQIGSDLMMIDNFR